MPQAPPDLGIVLICHQGRSRLAPALRSLAVSAGLFRSDLTLLLCGKGFADPARGARAADRAAAVLATRNLRGKIYLLASADAATALNHALTTLRVPARLAVYLDGAALIAPDSLSGIAALLSRHPEALGATGIPAESSVEAAEILRDGGRIHPALFALRPALLDRWAETGLRLPPGLAGPHWLLARLVCHDLDPARSRWNPQRLRGAVEAIVSQPRAFAWPHPARSAATLRRHMEIAALFSILARRDGTKLASSADTLVADWLDWGGTIPVSRRERPFLSIALRQIARDRALPRPDLRPVLAGGHR